MLLPSCIVLIIIKETLKLYLCLQELCYTITLFLSINLSYTVKFFPFPFFYFYYIKSWLNVGKYLVFTGYLLIGGLGLFSFSVAG